MLSLVLSSSSTTPNGCRFEKIQNNVSFFYQMCKFFRMWSSQLRELKQLIFIFCLRLKNCYPLTYSSRFDKLAGSFIGKPVMLSAMQFLHRFFCTQACTAFHGQQYELLEDNRNPAAESLNLKDGQCSIFHPKNYCWICYENPMKTFEHYKVLTFSIDQFVQTVILWVRNACLVSDNSANFAGCCVRSNW